MAEDRLRRAEFRAVRDRLVVLGVALLSIVIDLGFLAIWLLVLQLARAVFDPLRGHSRSAEIIYGIVEVVSIASTLAVVVAYVVRDAMLSIRRIWKLLR